MSYALTECVRVTDPREIEAIQNGEVQGDIYSDGECYANALSLTVWRQQQPHPEKLT